MSVRVQPGQVTHVSITDIMRNLCESCDYGSGEFEEIWDSWLSEVSWDSSFWILLEAIPKDGFQVPVCIRLDPEGWFMGNGHHRVAAAIMLGLDTIPVYFSEDDYYASEVTEPYCGQIKDSNNTPYDSPNHELIERERIWLLS